MINVLENKQCCGCGACVQVCPKECIIMVNDTEGFRYPKVDHDRCIDCHLCEQICPMLQSAKPGDPQSVEAMRFQDKQKRIESSSGGVFTAIAEEIIRRDGVVFGAAWTDDWQVEHRYCESIDGLAAFRGSKYVQSDTGCSYRKVRDFLRQGRWVLFSGTPCQCRGLKLYLRKDYDKLVTVDFICHGVPSNKVFRAYLKEEIRNYVRKDVEKNSVLLHPIRQIPEPDALVPSGWRLKGIRFRDKRNGWKKYSFALALAEVTTEGEQNTVLHSPIFPNSSFMKGFGANIYLRPSCHNCPARSFSSGSDITLADYWGIEEQHPEMDDDKGTSLVAVHTEKATKLLNDLNDSIERKSVNAKDAYKIQLCLNHNMPVSRYREEFWASDYENDFSNVVNRICKRRTLRQRIINSIKFVLRTIGVKRVYKYIKKKL
ncbi:MAG: Coenzyme F420 hydrogenase/dehydrogenase, beta subunit C-terminal domain [Prevotella sp.]|nr:Coenzyme F420 hydrogenase/dehydrogenase, beta subunit C-terminal domain [Prevotella sp.]